MTKHDGMMWKEVIEVFSAVLVSMGGLELVKWLATRKANTRKADAEADRAGIEARDTALGVMERTNTFLSQQVESLTKQVYDNTQMILDLKGQVADLRLKLEQERVFHCEVRKCADRLPPGDF